MPRRPPLASPLVRLFLGLLAAATVPGFTARPALAAWSGSGNLVISTSVDEQPGYSFNHVGSNIAPDHDGGMFVAWTYPTSGDSIRINRMDGQNGALAWGANGIKVNVGGNAAGPPHLVSDGSGGGVWVVWSDTHTGQAGIWVQHFDRNGGVFFPNGGLNLASSLTSNGDIDLDVACTPGGKLLLCYFENGVGLRVRKIDQFANDLFAAGGTLVTTDDTPSVVQLMADGEGAIVTWASDRASLPGNAGVSRVLANRLNSSGVVQWGSEGVVVQAGAGVTASDHRSVWDGTNLFVTWRHAATTNGVHAQKLSGSGAALWGSTTSGATVVNDIDTPWDRNSTVQRQPRVVSDGAGGIIVVWVDARDYDRPAPNGFIHAQDIYGQRLDVGGSRMWVGSVGAALDSTAGTQDELQAVSDRNGGVHLVYHDLALSAGTTEDDIHARRVNGSGVSQWQSFLNDGIPADGEQMKPRIVGDDAIGACFYAWEDHRDDATKNADVYASRRSLTGSTASPALTVTFPNGGESFFSGEAVNVTWTSTYGYLVGNWFGINTPSTFIGPLPTFDDGSNAWTVPAFTGSWRVWVKDEFDGVPRDSSNTTFTTCSTITWDHDETGFSTPVALAKGDFNEDGILDVLLCDANGVHVLKGNGAGGIGNGDFSVTGNLLLTGGARGVVVGDFNEDGRLDFAATFSTGVSVWFGNGTGTVGNGSFTVNANYAVGSNPMGLATTDLNEDGILDLVVTNAGSNNVSVLLGNGSGGTGNGTFASAVNWAVGQTPVAVVVGDFNEDGRRDIAVSNDNAASNSVSILLGGGTAAVGNGTFAAAATYPAGQNPYGLATGDFNEDGITDLAVACNTTTGVAILLGNGAAGVGNGTFAAPVAYATGLSSTRDVVVGDFNNDGRADVLAAGASGDGVIFLFGDGTGPVGDGTFTAGGLLRDFFDFPTALLLGDFKEDGVADPLVVNMNSNDLSVREGECPTALSTALAITSPNGGEFGLIGSEQTVTWTKGDAIQAVDVEISRDGGTKWEPLAQNVTGTSYTWTVVGAATTTARFRVTDSALQNRTDTSDANFTIGSAVLTLTSPNGGGTIQTMSFSQIQWTSNLGGNVRLEYALTGQSRQVVVASTPNTGSFLWTVPNGPSGPAKMYVTSLDFPAQADSSNTTFNFCARFPSRADENVSGTPRSVAVGDVNGDGIDDAVVASQIGYDVFLGLGSGGVGNGDFGTGTHVSVGGGALNEVALADLDHDGILDLLAAFATSVAVMKGNGTNGAGNGTFGSPVTFSTVAAPQSMVVSDWNEDGIPDLAVGVPTRNVVDVFIGQGAGGVGNGTFGTPTELPAAGSPQSLVVSDFDEDGIPDLAVGCTTGTTIRTFFGQGSGGLGNGTFAAGATYATPSGVTKLVAGDFNFDGRIDLVAGAGSNIGLYVANGAGSVGNGTFAPAVLTALPHSPLTDLVAVNFALDEFTELGVLFNGGQLTMMVNDGADTFQSLGDVTVGNKPLDVATGDFDENGSTDYLVANSFDTDMSVLLGNDCNPSFPANPITVTSPNGGESLTAGTTVAITFDRADEAVMVDIDLSRDDGRHWQPIARGVNDLSFAWNVVGPPADSARVRVRDFSTPTWVDVSDGVFHISDALVGVPDDGALPRVAAFSNARPNPSAGEMSFDLALPREANVQVDVLDVAGRVVGTLASGRFGAGVHAVRWSDGGAGVRTARAGVYFVRAKWEGFESVRSVVRMP